MCFFLDFRSSLGTWGAVGDKSCDQFTSKAIWWDSFLTSARAVRDNDRCYFMRMRCWKLTQKQYHKGKRATSNTNIKTKSSLLGYKTNALANVTLCACVVGHSHKEVPQGWAYHIHCKYKGQVLLLGYKTMPLVDVTSCACVVGNHPKRVPQA